MERYNVAKAGNAPINCPFCQKTCGNSNCLLIHAGLGHDKAYVMQLYEQTTTGYPHIISSNQELVLTEKSCGILSEAISATVREGNL